MPPTIHAIFENGVFRPTQPVNLPDHAEVELEFHAVSSANGALPNPVEPPSLDELYSILGKRFPTGEHDIAARHNEHQP
jgi:predicted DNA-binding antitoxin AbrB/MazE fold protein